MTTRDPNHDKVMDWVEHVSIYLAPDGVPPIAGRVLGWLMICDPPEQTAAGICAAVGVGRASPTTSPRTLTTMGFVSGRTRPRQRTVYYRLQPGAAGKVIARQIAGAHRRVEHCG